MRSALALVLSLALTGALLGMNFALYRTRLAAPATDPERKLTVTTKRLVRNLPPPPPAATTAPTNPPPFHWSALESPDYATYAANLRAVGCPERTLRDILLPDIEKLYAERERQLEDRPEDNFWETADQRDARQRARDAKLHALELEKRALIRQLLGADWNFAALKELRSEGFASAIMELLLGFTDTAKSDHLFTTHQMFEDDVQAHQTATEGIVLDEDVPKLQTLRDRFEAELARVLAPPEVEELRLRLAALEGMEHLSRRNGVSITGAELREIANLRAVTHDMLAKALNLDDELYPEELRAKGEAAFAELLRRFLGTERFADAERAKDQLFRELLQSTDKQGVAKAALVQAYEVRRVAESQAREIRADQQLTTEERATLLAALRAQTTQTLARSLGPVGFGAYLKQHGQQFTNSLSLPVTRLQALGQRTDVITVK
ncbi:MAG: Peptidoglycan-binding LysM [Limisphaerales bacterium]|nr:MAG: Peptidoglycan-binding LysM [Limisphaerales bacterium]KAG0508241.1 MAG: Peptidoglycan-binding LysM [Limisphaerales bacterium]TXT51662.1 MAG: Peptidoglycan-binding LysM [Limisphaerales bacterium]